MRRRTIKSMMVSREELSEAADLLLGHRWLANAVSQTLVRLDLHLVVLHVSSRGSRVEDRLVIDSARAAHPRQSL